MEPHIMPKLVAILQNLRKGEGRLDYKHLTMATTLEKKTPTTRALPLGVCPLVIPSAQSWISLEKEPEQW